MNLNDYQEFCKSVAIYGPEFAVTYPICGLAGEAGELSGAYSKILRDQQGIVTPENKEHLKKELGDILWFIAQTCTDLGITLESVLETNVSKLRSRKERNVLSGSGDNR